MIFFTLLANQILDATKINRHYEADATQRYNAAIAAFHQIAPVGPLEGMLATQLIACHMAMMDCYAHLNRTNDRITHEYHLNHVNKLSRTSVALLEALNRHRRKGQQKVTVEHVHVHAGGQAVVGTVESTGGGDKAKLEDQPHAKQTAHAPQPEVWSEDKERGSMPITSDGERPVSHARGKVTRSADGEQ